MIAPTNNKVTVVDFFPTSEAAWKKLVRRLRD